MHLVDAKSASNAADAVANGRAVATDVSRACAADQVPMEVSDAGKGGDRASVRSSGVTPAESAASSEDRTGTGNASSAHEAKPIAAADVSSAHATEGSDASHHEGAASEAAASQGCAGRDPNGTAAAAVAANSLTNSARFSNIGFIPRR